MCFLDGQCKSMEQVVSKNSYLRTLHLLKIYNVVACDCTGLVDNKCEAKPSIMAWELPKESYVYSRWIIHQLFQNIGGFVLSQNLQLIVGPFDNKK